MTDYDSIRTCCSGKGICKRCWGFIAAAVKVLDSGIRDTFGYQHLLWVYSGRRGIHCWISDKEAMELTDDQRKSLMGWMEVVKGGKEVAKKVNVRQAKHLKTLHPFLRTALATLREEFNNLILKDQNCFAAREGWDQLLELLPKGQYKEELEQEWEKHRDRPSSKKWEDIAREMKSLDDYKRVGVRLSWQPNEKL
jgi:DNA primase small subunit